MRTELEMLRNDLEMHALQYARLSTLNQSVDRDGTTHIHCKDDAEMLANHELECIKSVSKRILTELSKTPLPKRNT